MVERTEMRSSPIRALGIPGRKLGLYSAAWLAGALPLFAMITALWLDAPRFNSTGILTIGAFALVFPVMVRQLGVPRDASFVRFLLVAGIAFGILSILTGWGNGLTDEPFTTPRFVTLLWAHQDPYVVPLVFNYVQYGQTIHSSSIYPYLPLLMFLQVPGLDYKWFALACWVGMVLLVRKKFDVGVWLAQPYVAVMAASGYNDFPVLLLLTVAFVGVEGRRQRWAQLLALGAKQFANAIVVAYYLVRRDWKNVLVTLGVSAAFIVPFVVWSGPTVLCPTVFANRLTSCPSGGPAEYLLNYGLYPVWVLAIFSAPVVSAVRSSSQKGRLSRVLARGRLSVENALRSPAFAMVGISGALAGVSAFLAAGIYFGSAPPGALISALLGFAVLAGWVVAWDAAGRVGGRFAKRSFPPLVFQAGVQGVALALNMGALGVVLLFGRPALDGEIVGVFLAALWESMLFYRAQLLGGARDSASGTPAVPGTGIV